MRKLSSLRIVWIGFVFCAAQVAPSPAQTLTNLVSFNGTSGSSPSARLVQATDGNFYGTTHGGGANGWGTVFKITPAGTLTTLYNFCAQTNCTDGSAPYAGLVQATDGNFYGTTVSGGTFSNASCGGNCGTVFKITPGGTLTTLHSFCAQANCGDGATPYGGLVQGTDGNLYGTTAGVGGSPGSSTVFKITLGGTLTTLHSFNGTDGTNPHSALVQATDGNLYGTTENGGATTGNGTVFKITPGGTLTTLYKFCSQPNCTDGALPVAGLAQASDGNFYGTTASGGTITNASCAGNCGTVFRITPGGTLTTLYSFCAQTGCSDGNDPLAGLVQGTDGNLYGTTYVGGAISCISIIALANGCGTVFKITPGGTLTTLHRFVLTDGNAPEAGLVQATNGSFYGTTQLGGTSSNCVIGPSSGCGTVFSLGVGLGPFVETIPTFGPVGASVTILGNNLTGATAVSFNGTPATFTVVSSSEIQASVPSAATTGTVQVTTPSGTLNSNVPFHVKKAVAGDFDGDQESDISVWRPATGTWYAIPSSAPSTFTATQWGISGDTPVPGDYDGDGKTDMAVWRPATGTWYVIPSSAPLTFTATQWGVSGDTPVPGDYDGDGKTDLAVWRSSTGTWYVIPSSAPTTFTATQWGVSGDVPVPGDYDGDGKIDKAVWRPSTGTWYILPSSKPGTFIAVQWGVNGDIPVPGDYDGDGKTDIAVWRPTTGTWYVIPSSAPTTFAATQWGVNGDTPVPGDYDGDGKVDKAVWRPSIGTWFIIPTSAPNTFRATQWGINGDVPIQKPIGQ